jgi:hydroxymethylbilane synthase
VSGATLRIATRASRLALWQAEYVANRLKENEPGLEVQLVHVTTTGDRDVAASLSGLGGVGVFTREIQQALLDGRADVAVHSLKDLPTVPVPGIQLAAVPSRAEPWDALVLPRDSACAALRDLPRAARVGTACVAGLSFCTCGPICNSWTSAATWRRGCVSSTREPTTRSCSRKRASTV